MSNVEQKLQAMGLKLPACPAPVAAYLPVQNAFIWTPYVPIMQKYNICT